VQLRRSPTLNIDYQEQWESLQTRASELLSAIRQKCIKVHNAASMHYVSHVHLVEDQTPLYLANIQSHSCLFMFFFTFLFLLIIFVNDKRGSSRKYYLIKTLSPS